MTYRSQPGKGLGAIPWRGAGPSRGACGGFTLVEILVAALLGCIVAAAGVALLHTHGAIARASQSEIATVG